MAVYGQCKGWRVSGSVPKRDGGSRWRVEGVVLSKRSEMGGSSSGGFGHGRREMDGKKREEKQRPCRAIICVVSSFSLFGEKQEYEQEERNRTLLDLDHTRNTEQ